MGGLPTASAELIVTARSIMGDGRESDMNISLIRHNDTISLPEIEVQIVGQMAASYVLSMKLSA